MFGFILAVDEIECSPILYVRTLQHDIDDRRKRYQKIEFCWVPSHVGIRGNEQADTAAKRATKKVPALLPIPHRDYCNMASRKLDEKLTKQ